MIPVPHVPSLQPRASGCFQGRAGLTSQLAARDEEGSRLSPPPPGQSVFSLKPQADLSCLAEVPLPYLCSHTAQGQARKVSPLLGGCRSATQGLAEGPSLEHETFSSRKVSHQPSLPCLLLQVPGPWLGGQTGHRARRPPPQGLGVWARLWLQLPPREGHQRHRPGSHPSSLSTQLASPGPLLLFAHPMGTSNHTASVNEAL